MDKDTYMENRHHMSDVADPSAYQRLAEAVPAVRFGENPYHPDSVKHKVLEADKAQAKFLKFVEEYESMGPVSAKLQHYYLLRYWGMWFTYCMTSPQLVKKKRCELVTWYQYICLKADELFSDNIEDSDENPMRLWTRQLDVISWWTNER